MNDRAGQLELDGSPFGHRDLRRCSFAAGCTSARRLCAGDPASRRQRLVPALLGRQNACPDGSLSALQSERIEIERDVWLDISYLPAPAKRR